MSSLLSELESLKLLEYILVATTTAVCYDYVLTLSREVELIWMRPWSMLSTLFVLARYVGLAVVIMFGLGSGFGIFYMSESVGTIMLEILVWTRLIYTVMVDVIMILRVSVMFNQPKRTRQILFFLYFLVTVNTIVFAFLWEGPHSGLSITTVPLDPFIDGTLCSSMLGHSSIDFIYDGIPRGLFDILLMVLAIYRFAMHAIETRRMMGKQRINKYMTLLLEHSILYFFLNFAYEALAAGTLLPSSPTLYAPIATLYMNSIPFMIYPRLVLNMKGYRATSGAVHIGSEGSGYPRSHGHSKSPSVPVTDSGEYELSEGPSQGASQHTRGQNC